MGREVIDVRVLTLMKSGPAKSWMTPSLRTMPAWPISGHSHDSTGMGAHTTHSG
jgi:hypothetical protein